jgi:flagellar biosynthesis protein FlhB
LISARFIETSHTIPFDMEHLRLLLVDVLVDIAISLGPLTALLMLMAVLSSVGQFGWLFAPKKIAPKLTKISVISGFKRLFSWKSVMEFVKGIAKIVVVSLVALAMTLPIIGDLAVLPDMDLADTLQRLHAIAIRLVIGTLAVMTVIAVLDFFYQQQVFMKQQRMTPHEVKDEHKQAEGDPHIKARIRRIRAERARQRMMAAVPTADVVVTNPTHYAVALTYDMSSMQAPKLVAKGVDNVAMRIRQVAEENDVPIMENPPVARALYAAVELDEEIPPEHYKAVAEIIGYVMRLRGELPRSA